MGVDRMLKKKDRILSTGDKLSLTTFSSILYQTTTIISGFILPKLILLKFGTSVNGLVVSITQFLGLISFLDMGVGQVVQSNLYAPLAKKNYEKVSDVLTSGKKFFKNLARIFVVYTILLAVGYPIIVQSGFGFRYTATLVVIISINSFAQYYFGITYQLLLNSDQRGYIQYFIQTATLIVNILASVFLMNIGCNIQTVKFGTALIYLLRPFLMYMYVKKEYPEIQINKKLDYEPINQKWNGLAQHIASVVLNNTDTVVLTMLSSLEAVSVYAVYNLVVSGVKQLFMSMTSGIQPLLGQYWAEKNLKKLNKLFGLVEWAIHQGTVLVFGCTAVLMVPFVRVYTANVTDYNYIAVAFGMILTVAHAVHCIRLPYNMMVLAGGHFKQTQSCYAIAAIMNIVVSVIAVKQFGLVGVAVGTLVSMAYQTYWLVNYVSKNLICWSKMKFFKQIFVDVVIVAIASVFSYRIVLVNITTYWAWVTLAFKALLIWMLVTVITNMILNRSYMQEVIGKIHKAIK